MTTIHLIASDLAKLTGHNTYEPLQNTIDKILVRNNLSNKYIPKSNLEQQLLELPSDEILKMKMELKVRVDASVTDMAQEIEKRFVSTAYNTKLSETQSKQIVDKKLTGSFSQLNDSVKKDLRMTRGVKKETSNLNTIQKRTGAKIGQRNSKLYQKILYSNDRYEINIRGKVDGIADGYIVESKNRTNRLFNTLRPYERVQMEGYMFLTGLNKSVLTEHYDDTSNTIHCIHNEPFWNKCVERIIQFIETHIAVNI